ncbi:Ppx/GppA phosphatase family protein [Pedobacter metabolipauper]|uniref:Exopolyphosphatase/guanosine-5'-triphosphate, 3'-diphosphate pyrophosphatase n=1 Tax=Pedobacter metabolipauper TaxID=425513 RepID=A0A4R6SSZ4_9SPHI|nr:exopolyphosphatase [Pedobacter metabolipauper]TDQ08525.1 exopolyphosphatase/guanosine-5'-triphosphate,3'-diphosphate pyrophosphatase [Pedobacter metabolipauper]
MTAAVIDLGTNTFHLIIARISAAEIEVIYKTNLPVKLGEGKINENLIIPEAFERGLEALKGFNETIKQHDVSIVKAIATSAIRSASNGVDFVKAAKEQAGIAIDVISGDEEAAYIYKGVKATGAITGSALIMDIGGGSTEFILCDSQAVFWKKSYNIGAARLHQAYFNSDPINAPDQAAIVDRIARELTDLKEACALYKPEHLIGSAGAFETFAGMVDGETNIKQVRSAPIEREGYETLSKKLIASSHAEREVMPGLIKLRVDMIVIAAILTNYVLDISGISKMSLSTYDLKMGVLYSLTELERG